MGTKGYFNPETVSQTAATLKNTYFGILRSVIGEIQHDFIVPIGELWHGADAIRVMGMMATQVNAAVWGNHYVGGFEEMLKSAIFSVDSAGRRWAQDSEITNQYVSVVESFEAYTPDYKLKVVDVIKEKREDGASGMDIAGVKDKLSVLTRVISSVETHTQNSVTAVETSGFLEDYGIESTLIETITEHKNRIINIINDNVTAIENAIKEAQAIKEGTFAETKSAFAGESQSA